MIVIEPIFVNKQKCKIISIKTLLPPRKETNHETGTIGLIAVIANKNEHLQFYIFFFKGKQSETSLFW